MPSYAHKLLIMASWRRLLLFLVMVQSLTFVTLWFSNSDFHVNNKLRRKILLQYTVSKMHSTIQNQQQHEDPCIPKVPPNVNCRLMMMGDENYLTPTEPAPEQNKTGNCLLRQLLTNCSRFKSTHGYDSFRVSREELEFPLAFTLKIHKAAEQVEQILRTIYRPHNVYCIYVDLKAKTDVFESMKNISRCLKNVHVIEDRERIIYASYSHVRAELACMKRCMKSPVQWKYYLNMAGEEFPLRTNEEMVHIFRKMGGSNDIASRSAKGVENRFKLKHFHHKNSSKKTKEHKTPFPYRVDMRRGSAYGSFSRGFVKFILEDNIARDLVKWFNESLSPEEHVWSTLNALPFAPGGYTTEVGHDTNTFLSRAMIWSWDKIKCEGQFVRSVCTFGPRALPWISISPKLILNKVKWEKERILFDCLEEDYRNRSDNPQLHKLNWYHYLNLPHVQYYSELNENDTSPVTLAKKKAEWLQNNVVTTEQNSKTEH